MTPPARLTNLTPHPINIESLDPIPPSGQTPHIEETTLRHDTLTLHSGATVPIALRAVLRIALPPPQPNHFYLVSRPIALLAPHRTDLLVPGAHIRDHTNRITGCRQLDRLIPGELCGGFLPAGGTADTDDGPLDVVYRFIREEQDYAIWYEHLPDGLTPDQYEAISDTMGRAADELWRILRDVQPPQQPPGEPNP